MTNALQYVVDDAKMLESACAALDDPPTKPQLKTVQAAMRQLGADMDAGGTIMDRNGDLLHSEAGR